jgi:hypothetical protein
LELFPRPLLDALVQQRWLPMVGAGFSRNASHPADKRVPDWAELASQIQAELSEGADSTPSKSSLRMTTSLGARGL